MKFYKILTTNFKHFNMKYHKGLNKNCENTIFNGEDNHGLFFSDAKNIMRFCHYGTKIATIEIPENERYQLCNDKIKYKANKFIIKDVQKLWSVSVIKNLVEEGVDIHVNHDFLFRQAVILERLDIMKYLYSLGTDISSDDDIALWCAAREGKLKSVKFLLEKGADPHADNDAAIQVSLSMKNVKVAKYLTGYKTRGESSFIRARNGLENFNNDFSHVAEKHLFGLRFIN